MKIHLNFVSNSSSSSSIVLLPEGLTRNSADEFMLRAEEQAFMEEEEIDEESVREALELLLADGTVFDDCSIRGTYLLDRFFSSLHCFVQIIHAGPDEGAIIALDKEKLVLAQEKGKL